MKSNDNVVIELERRGDEIRDFTDYGNNKTEEFFFREGQTVTSTFLGVETKVQSQRILEGRLVVF